MRFCHHEKCKQNRSIAFSSDNITLKDFNCSHMRLIDTCEEPRGEYILTTELINQYPCDTEVKEYLSNTIMHPLDGTPAVYKVASKVFLAYGEPNTSAPLGFVHLVKDDFNHFKCLSKNCKASNSTTLGKQQTSKKFCEHQHLIMCTLRTELQTADVVNAPQQTAANAASEVSVLHGSTLELNVARSLPYVIPANWLRKAVEMDAASTLSLKEVRFLLDES